MNGMDWNPSADLKIVKELQVEFARIAISAVLPQIYQWGMVSEPKHIVELGVSKEALANKVLTLIAKRFGSTFLSCDLYDFKNVNSYEKWMFIKGHDIGFSKNYVEDCKSMGIDHRIDLLFIDTDELYPHTKQEIHCWYPFLNHKSTVMWRCTNLKKELVYPGDLRTNLGWNNERGVIRALEEYHQTSFDEGVEFVRQVGMWEVIHYPWGAGLTILRRGYDKKDESDYGDRRSSNQDCS